MTHTTKISTWLLRKPTEISTLQNCSKEDCCEKRAHDGNTVTLNAAFY